MTGSINSFLCLVLLLSWLFFVMSLFSITYGHPDEDETRGSIDYYLAHWGLPDFDDVSLQNAYSNYGTVRLTERSFYYILAGKFGWICKNIFHISAYYRMFNVLLLVLFWWHGYLPRGVRTNGCLPFYLQRHSYGIYFPMLHRMPGTFYRFFVVTEAIREDGLIADAWKEGFFMETIWWNALICLFVRTNLDGKEKLFDRSFCLHLWFYCLNCGMPRTRSNYS